MITVFTPSKENTKRDRTNTSYLLGSFPFAVFLDHYTSDSQMQSVLEPAALTSSGTLPEMQRHPDILSQKLEAGPSNNPPGDTDAPTGLRSTGLHPDRCLCSYRNRERTILFIVGPRTGPY